MEIDVIQEWHGRQRSAKRSDIRLSTRILSENETLTSVLTGNGQRETRLLSLNHLDVVQGSYYLIKTWGKLILVNMQTILVNRPTTW
jgi:hypothetical protein